MTERPRLFDDLAGVAGGAMSAIAGLREEMTSLIRARVEETIRRFDLVRREEFEAMSEVATRARAACEALEARVAELETATIPAPPRDDVSPSAPPPGPAVEPEAGGAPESGGGDAAPRSEDPQI